MESKIHIVSSHNDDIILARIERIIEIMEKDPFECPYFESSYRRLLEACMYYELFLDAGESE